MTKHLIYIYLFKCDINSTSLELSSEEVKELKLEKKAIKTDQKICEWVSENNLQPPSYFKDFNIPIFEYVEKQRLTHILLSCWINYKSGGIFSENFPRERDQKSFPLRLWENEWNPKTLLDEISQDLVDKINEEGIRVNDTEGLKEYYKEEDCEAPEVNSEDFRAALRDCTWQGPFVHDGAEKLEHYYIFTINEKADNSYYVVLEIDLREFNEQKRQIITLWTRKDDFTMTPKKKFVHLPDPENWEFELQEEAEQVDPLTEYLDKLPDEDLQTIHAFLNENPGALQEFLAAQENL